MQRLFPSIHSLHQLLSRHRPSSSVLHHDSFNTTQIRYSNISAHISSHTALSSIKCWCKLQAPKQKSCLQCFDSVGWTSERVFRWR